MNVAANNAASHVVCRLCDRAVPVEFYGQHHCEPMQPRERPVNCWRHHLATWDPMARCELCELEDQT